MSNLVQILLSAQKGDANSQAANDLLNAQTRQNPAQFMLEISGILADENSIVLARQIAGLVLKNTINNANNDPYLNDIWYKIEGEIKPQIRNNVLGTLASLDRSVRMTAAQAVASIAKKDIPRNDWPEILNILVTNAMNMNPMFKQASLMTLGYICEDLPPECVDKPTSDQILTAIAANMTPEESNIEVKQIALQALRNSLPFTRSNFQNETEKQVIINLLCSSAQSTITQISVEALQALCDIAYQYYDFLTSALFQLGNVTYGAISQEIVEIGVLGIEFWNVIADIEVLRMQSNQTNNGFTNTAANSLVPILLSKITNYEDEDDDWNLHKACSSCISAIAQLIKDPIVDLVSNFISKEIRSSNWKNRDSAALLLGSIVDGPSEGKLTNLISAGIDALKNLMTDANLSVRQTAAWSLSKICELQYRIVTQPQLFNQIIPRLIDSLKDDPKIACHCCWALINLVDHCSEVSLFKRDIINLLLNSLLEAAYRNDSFNTEHNLQLAAYSAVNTVIEKSPSECIPLFETRIPQFIDMLKQTTTMPRSEQIQAFICSTLQACFARASQGSITDETARVFMETIITIFNMRGSVLEDGMQAVGALAGNIENRFLPYMESFSGFLLWALNKIDSMSICRAGTMCVGDMARALNEKIGPYMGHFVPPLLRNLESDVVSTDVKVLSIESLADFAGHTKKLFIEYLGTVLVIIEGAANASVQGVREAENPDLFDYLADLREVILEFYVGLLEGLVESGNKDILLPNLQNIVNYTLMTVDDRFRPNKNSHSNAIGLLGDLARAYRNNVTQILRIPIVNTYLNKHKNSTDPMLREIANYAIREISSN